MSWFRYQPEFLRREPKLPKPATVSMTRQVMSQFFVSEIIGDRYSLLAMSHAHQRHA
jgi:hypothetical protein